ncbi:MAG: cytochrome c [Bacteroidetes bacterium]|nr:cytochrome c [Bacteroidota bacterium]MBS1981757.1 cytochrome c [Bacteroidota bacterium]
MKPFRIKSIGILSLAILAACSHKHTVPPPDLAKGKAIYEATCKTCHGVAGEGNQQMKSPALANLDGDYLLRQFRNFKNNVRGGVQADTLGNQMATIAKTLNDTLLIRDVIAYIDSMPQVKSMERLSGDWKNGEQIYQGLCGSCHGPEGKGNVKLNAPQLNGLSSWYLRSQFNKFKNGYRGVNPNDKYGVQMAAIVTVVKESQSVEDVITYLRSDIPVAK